MAIKGEERYRSITKAYFRGAHSVCIVYDSTESNSSKVVNDLKYWEQLAIQESSSETKPFMVFVGNKCDKLDSSKQVVSAELNQFLQLMKYKQ